ncbi:hypothetical protein AOQ84DRAFT_415316 [Glonium stellatum]|uniref:Uncharacterized protein n=1 Tax=Glonium stellatum TaxID=574774 RepID=A0A8E2ETX0_9PEZI|nr:hypothetical protein AOQ84DRAFT_415316 [Glonium stellatum]
MGDTKRLPYLLFFFFPQKLLHVTLRGLASPSPTAPTPPFTVSIAPFGPGVVYSAKTRRSPTVRFLCQRARAPAPAPAPTAAAAGGAPRSQGLIGRKTGCMQVHVCNARSLLQLPPQNCHRKTGGGPRSRRPTPPPFLSGLLPLPREKRKVDAAVHRRGRKVRIIFLSCP